MRMPGRPDWLTDEEDEYRRVYHPEPAAPAWPEVDVDLDRPPRVPFGFQVPARPRTSERGWSTQARALMARSGS